MADVCEPPIETLANVTGELVSLADAKRELRVWSDDDDARVASYLTAAHRHCEMVGEISLHQSATRTYATRCWPSHGWRLRWPPVASVNSVTYYDAAGVLQTWSPSNYQTTITAHGYGVVSYAGDATLPAIADRPDAVVIAYTTGWGTEPPQEAAAAILLALRYLYGEDDERELRHAKMASDNLLASMAAWQYR